jgi:VanZ family protein
VGNPTTHTIRVPRWVTIALLLILSAAMAMVVVSLAGHAYERERLTAAQTLSMIRRYDRGSMSNSAVLATIAPAIADILFFLPWGALAFLSFDGGEQHRLRTYLVTVAVGVTFALGLVAWQSALPTRVTGWNDAAWQIAGCIAGAVLGHLRKRVRLRFE